MSTGGMHRRTGTAPRYRPGETSPAATGSPRSEAANAPVQGPAAGATASPSASLEGIATRHHRPAGHRGRDGEGASSARVIASIRPEAATRAV